MSYSYRITPRGYQKSAMKLIYNRKRVGLFFEMGTGKTKIVLDFLGAMFTNKKIARALVIAPLTALDVWEDEIDKNWPSNLTYSLLRPDTPDTWEDAQLVLINYDYARRIIKDLIKWSPDVVTIDESHRIKNPNAKQSRAAHRLGPVCRYAICLTGTPIGNHPLDLWSQFKFLVPDLLDEKFKDFKKKYGVWGKFGGFQLIKYKRLPRLARLVGPYVRSLKKGDEIPAKNFIEYPVEMGDYGRKIYKDMERDFVTFVKEESGLTPISAPIVLAKLAKLSQISGGYIRDTEKEKNFPVHTAKLDALREITDNLIESDVKRVIVFARFLWEIEEIKKVLGPKWPTYTIKGGVPREQRKLAISMFNESGGAMICQTTSGSASMNLQAANYVIFYSLNYSHIDFLQAQDRVHRIGQTKPCFYYMLLCKGTLDRPIYRLLKQKKNIADEMITLVKTAQQKGLQLVKGKTA